MNQSKPANSWKNQPHWVDLIIVAALVFATIVINLQMIRYGLNGLGDVRWHITWVQHFSQQLAEGIWYPRWIAGTNFGYGSPTFVFYPPLAYYIGSLLKFIGFSSEATMTLLFSLPLFLSGLAFYGYGRHQWGSIPAALGALFYMNTPVFIGAINFGNLANLWAYPWIPLGLYLTDQSIIKPKVRILLAGLAAIIALTHTPSLLIYTIAWFIYLLFLLLEKPFKAIFWTFTHGALGLGLASLYLLPAILEQKFVNLDYQFGSKGGFLMLQISDLIKNGWSDILVKNLAALVIFTVICLWALRHNQAETKRTLSWLAVVIIIFFMISNWSEFIWQSSSTLLRIQRSTRVFGLFYFGEAALFTLAVRAILQLNWKWKILPSVLLFSIFLGNFYDGYQLVRKSPGLHSPTTGTVFIREWMEIALQDPYSNKLIDVPEYRPLLSGETPNPDVRERYQDGKPIPYIEGGTAYFPIPELDKPEISVISGDASIDIQQWRAYERQFNITAMQPATLRIRTYYYPAWHLYLNQTPHPIMMSEEGTLEFEIATGSYQALLKYEPTLAFIGGIVLSLISLFGLVTLNMRKFLSSSKI
jgi:hypothetical protein